VLASITVNWSIRIQQPTNGGIRMLNDDNKSDDNGLTHVAWAFRQARKRRTIFIVPLAVGQGRIEADGTPVIFQDRDPKGGCGDWHMKVVLLPRGVEPITKKAPKSKEAVEDELELTHTAWAFQQRRRGRTTFVVPLDVGQGRIDPEGIPVIYLDREPKGGWGDWIAKIVLLLRGVDPMTKTPPERVDEDETDEDDDERGERPDRRRMNDNASRITARCEKK
jgi:hypothetical protein